MRLRKYRVVSSYLGGSAWPEPGRYFTHRGAKRAAARMLEIRTSQWKAWVTRVE